MKKTLLKILCPLFLLLAIVSIASPAHALRCMYRSPFTGQCIYGPDLLPGAHDVPTSYAPAIGENMICTGHNFTGYCQAFPGTNDYPNFQTYGWFNANPAISIKSVYVGNVEYNWWCLGTNYTGTNWTAQAGGWYGGADVYPVRGAIMSYLSTP